MLVSVSVAFLLKASASKALVSSAAARLITRLARLGSGRAAAAQDRKGVHGPQDTEALTSVQLAL